MLYVALHTYLYRIMIYHQHHLPLICLNVLFVHESPQRANYLINVAGSIINYIMQKANMYLLH